MAAAPKIVDRVIVFRVVADMFIDSDSWLLSLPGMAVGRLGSAVTPKSLRPAKGYNIIGSMASETQSRAAGSLLGGAHARRPGRRRARATTSCCVR